MRNRWGFFHIFLSFAVLLGACAAPPPTKQTSFKYEVAPFFYNGSSWKRDLVAGQVGYSEITPKPGNTFPLGAYQFETLTGEGRFVYRVRAYGDGHEGIEVYCAVQFDVSNTVVDGILSPEECVYATGENADREVYPSNVAIKRMQQLSDDDATAYRIVVAYDYSIFSGPRQLLLIHKLGST